MIKDKKHLNPEGLEQIRKIKARMNTSWDLERKKILKNIKYFYMKNSKVMNLNLSVNIESQRAVWFIFPLFPIFLIFFIGSIAETNRVWSWNLKQVSIALK